MGDHLKKARETMGLTQAQVAEAIGRDQPAVSRYERGSRPDLSIVPAYAKVLGLTEMQVLFGADGPDEHESKPPSAEAA
ncbi:MAG: helix-turn-helix domain-containing protein [Arenimonas sp.]